MKVYLPEYNLPRGFWKSELREKFGPKIEVDSNIDAKYGPLLMEIMETYLKLENMFGNLSKCNATRYAANGAVVVLVERGLFDVWKDILT